MRKKRIALAVLDASGANAGLLNGTAVAKGHPVGLGRRHRAFLDLRVAAGEMRGDGADDSFERARAVEGRMVAVSFDDGMKIPEAGADAEEIASEMR